MKKILIVLFHMIGISLYASSAPLFSQSRYADKAKIRHLKTSLSEAWQEIRILRAEKVLLHKYRIEDRDERAYALLMVMQKQRELEAAQNEIQRLRSLLLK